MTVPSPLGLTLHPTNDTLFGGGGYLTGRALGRRGRLAFFCGPLAFAFGFGLYMAHLNGVPLTSGALVVLYSCVGAAFGLILVQFLWARRFRRLYGLSALRTAPVPITLSVDGVALEPRAPLPWSTVTEVSRWKDCTLIQFSPVDAIVLRDADLPPGETPQTLADRIAAWKAA